MSRFDAFKSLYDESIDYINGYIEKRDELMSDLVEWMLNTDENPYAFLPEGWAGSLSSAEGFASLVQCMHHAIYDDGDITFLTVNGEPRISFVWRHEDNLRNYVLTTIEKDMESREQVEYEIKILDIKPNEFGLIYDQFKLEDMKERFARDAAGDGIEDTVKEYSRYKQFNPAWVEECADDIKKWEDFYCKLQGVARQNNTSSI